MIRNIVDRRKRPYRWKAITAIIEATYHDNSCNDADQAEDDPDGVDYQERPEISLADAVAWAQAVPTPVTIYLYDLGEGIRVAAGETNETAHFSECGTRFR